MPAFQIPRQQKIFDCSYLKRKEWRWFWNCKNVGILVNPKTSEERKRLWHKCIL